MSRIISSKSIPGYHPNSRLAFPGSTKSSRAPVGRTDAESKSTWPPVQTQPESTLDQVPDRSADAAPDHMVALRELLHP